MKSNLLKVFLLLTSMLIISTIGAQFVYTIHYVRSFRDDLISKNLGCDKNIAFSTYLHPRGLMDALSLMINPGSYGLSIPNCNRKQAFAMLFGTAQDYNELLHQGAQSVAQRVHNTIRGYNKMIINWKIQLNGDLLKSKTWLQSFIGQLKANGVTVYLKAPASYFCYDVQGKPYLLDISNAQNYIIETYGEKVGQYTSFQQIFTNSPSVNPQDKSNYPQQNCPKFPSIQSLQNNNHEKHFYLGKTLQKQQAGYVGPRINEILQKASGIYQKLVFLDSYPEEMIQF